MPSDLGTPAKRGQGTGKLQNFPSITWCEGTVSSHEYPLNIDLYSHSADFIDLAQNSPCGSAQMVEAELEAIHEH